jgi:gliding motility-associated-like protein
MKFRLLLTFLCLLTNFSFSQNNWKTEYKKRKVFIENEGQFDEFSNGKIGKIKYAVDLGKTKILFGQKGVTYSFLDSKEVPKEERQALAEKIKINSLSDYKFREKLVGKFHFISDEVTMNWNNSLDEKIVSSNPTNDYHSYTFKNNSGNYVNKSNIQGFEQITYENIYPNIDIQFQVHAESGVKYAIILHPGANPSDVQMVYDKSIKLENGKIKIPTFFGDIIDHEPFTFYDRGLEIKSSFLINNANTVQFKLENYDKNRRVIIDPWTQTPTFATNWDCVWECDKDASGNVYVLGGIMPMQILKYNSVGALQWTYNTPYDTSNVWLGTFAVDNLGNSYVTAGSTAQIQKVSSAGALVWNNANPVGAFSNAEFWTITFNCDQTKLVVGGTGGSALTLKATVYDINVNTGAVITSADFAQGNATSFPPTIQEVRAICASPSGKYYYMTQDTVGAFSQNFNLCSGSPLLYKIDNSYDFGYKCENFRYDNSGICAIKANNSFYYTQNGSNVHKRNLQTGAIITSAPIPGGAATTSLGDFSVSNSGIDIDDCGNVYVGSSTGVVKFDANLTQLATYPTSFKVYDVHVSTSGDIIAGGSTGNSSNSTRTGYIQSFAASACAPLATNCCDATICPIQSLCQTDAPVTLTTATAGGTWSGSGMSSNGSFNPATAGVGTHTITYTLPCGSESITIVVSPCQALSACVETNGSITVSGGVGPYTWAYYQAATNTPITNQAQCQACGYTWFGFQCLNGFTPVTSCSTPAQWTNFATGTNATAPGGVTQVQVTDNSGTSTTFTIANLTACNSNPCPTITLTNTTQTNVSCNGGTNGSVTVSASGGTAPYTYNWTPGNLVGATQSNLSAGTYTVTATDNANCTGTLQVIITQPSVLQVSQGNITPASCGSNNGSASVTVAGGTSSYSYAWTPNVGNTASISNLTGGNYTVVVTDANSCSQTLNLTIPTTGGPTISSVTPTNPNCSDSNSGQIVISASGNGTLQYSLNGGTNQNSGTFSGLSAGNYSITVTDASGCISTSSATLTAPQTFILTEGNVVGSNCGSSNGSAQVIVNGGSGNFEYSWQPGGSMTAAASNLAPGNFTVTVNDLATGCSQSLQITVPAIGGPSITNVQITDVICNGEETGSISFSASGGTAPYSYSLNNGLNQSASSFTSLNAGTYTITVIDATNCPNSQTVEIIEPTLLVADAGLDVQSCAGESVTLNGNSIGGSFPITSYLWDQNQNTALLEVNPIVTTTYSLTVIDNNGCQATDDVTVSIIPCGALEIIVPNVFTPNGDNTNDEYGITSLNALSQEALIVNRWGEKMIELNNPNTYWNGKTPNGNEATEGVYFIKYRIIGPNGEEKIGHTFFHLER